MQSDETKKGVKINKICLDWRRSIYMYLLAVFAWRTGIEDEEKKLNLACVFTSMLVLFFWQKASSIDMFGHAFILSFSQKQSMCLHETSGEEKGMP